MQDLQEGFVDVGLPLEAVLDLVDVVDGMIELHRLVVLQRRGIGRATDRGVGLQGWGSGGGIGGDGRIGLAAWREDWRLQWLLDKDKTNMYIKIMLGKN